MEDAKYQILNTVRNALSIEPVRTTDFYKNPGTILECRQHIAELLRCELIRQDVASDVLRITTAGIIICEQEERLRADKASLDLQIKALEAIAEAAHREAEIAQKEAERAEKQAIDADKDAQFARRQSLRSNRIAACSVALSVITWVFTKDDVRGFLSGLFQWLQNFS